MALAATFLSTLAAVRQPQQPSQTLLYLGLGALLGVVYSLGTEKFMRAMHHRHIFVRNAMLWLAAVTWLLAVAVLIWVAANIYAQVGGGLEGFDRVLGVTIPFVVRADLVVDWAKRVSWALLNMLNWTQSTVQVRRLISRAPSMHFVVSVDDDVRTMIRNPQDRQHDLLSSEDRVWTEDADALVRVSEVIQHFEKLGRVACYACACLVLATPSALVWIVYALINGVISLTKSHFVLAALYFISIFLAPLGAIIMILASTGLLCGVVTLSVVGTAVQFAVYWSTRTVYSMVRIALSQAWAGFPHLKKPHAMPNVAQSPPGPNAGTMAVRAIRHPEEAGAAMACMGNLLPSELEFSLGSWDGNHKDHTFKPIGSSLSRHLMSFGNWFHHHIHSPHLPHGHRTHSHTPYTPKTSQTPKRTPRDGPSPANSNNADTSADASTSGRDENAQADVECAKASTKDITPPEPVSAAEESRRVIKDNERILILLGRLGLDLRIKSPRRRRLSTYYALAMLVHLQVESGGNAWRLHDTKEISEADFDERIRSLNCVVADEAKIAIDELSHRLRGSSKYRIIPSGYPNNRMIAVQMWLRLVLLSFLETPSDSDVRSSRVASDP